MTHRCFISDGVCIDTTPLDILDTPPLRFEVMLEDEEEVDTEEGEREVPLMWGK